MSVVLSILQVLGWILLIALLLVIAVLLIILFCPVRYLVEGEWLEEKWAKFKAHWLLHLFRVKITYGDDLVYGEVHLLWKKITFSFDLSKKDEETEEELKENLEDVKADVEENLTSKSVLRASDEGEKVVGTETVAQLRGEDVEEQFSEELEEIEVSDDPDGSVSENESSFEEETESIISKIKGIIERIKEIYQKSKKILQDEKNQDAIKHLKDEVVYLIKILMPKKSKVDAIYSTGSPDTTGQLFGVLAMFPAMYQRNWKIIPDFQADDSYFKGTFWGKGRVSGYQIIGIVLRIVFDKNCRRLYTILNKFINWLKKDDKSQEEK